MSRVADPKRAPRGRGRIALELEEKPDSAGGPRGPEIGPVNDPPAMGFRKGGKGRERKGKEPHGGNERGGQGKAPLVNLERGINLEKEERTGKEEGKEIDSGEYMWVSA